MRKIFHWAFSFVAMALGGTCLAGCTVDFNQILPSRPTVAIPDHFSFAQDVLSWGKVENASKYMVWVDGTEIETAETSYRFYFEKDCRFRVKIKAISSGKRLGDSDYSTIQSYDFLKTDITLSAPTFTGCKNNVLSWSNVEGASAYLLSINGISTKVDAPTYTVHLNSTMPFTAQVKALGKYGVSFDSPYNSLTTYQYDNGVRVPYNAPAPTYQQTHGQRIRWDALPHAKQYEVLLNESTSVITTDTFYDPVFPSSCYFSYKVRALKNDEWGYSTGAYSSLSEDNKYLNDVRLPLAKPVLSVSGNVVTWGAITNAASYYCEINGVGQTLTTPGPLEAVFYESTPVYVTVRAKAASDSIYGSSDAASISFNYTRGVSVPWSATSVLGKTINLKTAKNYNDVATSNPVLDPQELAELSVSTVDAASNLYAMVTSKSIVEVRLLSTLTNLEGDARPMNGLFADGFKADDWYSRTVGGKGVFQRLFAVEDHCYIRKKIVMTTTENSLQASIKSKLNGPFLSDITRYNYGNMSANELFTKYGTHLLTGAYYGVRLETFLGIGTGASHFSNYEAKILEKAIKDNPGSSLNNLLTILEGKDSNIVAAKSDAYFHSKSMGGIPWSEPPRGNYSSELTSWMNSAAALKSDSNLLVPIDYPADGLLGLWDCLPDSLQNVATRLKTEYAAYANDDSIAALKSEERSLFAGGDGSKKNPYQIETVSQLKNFSSSRWMFDDFHLNADIKWDSSEWTPLGWSNAHGQIARNIPPYFGNFSGEKPDGSSYTISNLKRTDGIESFHSKQNPTCYGFISALGKNYFSQIGSTISGSIGHVNFSNYYINVTSNGGDNGDLVVLGSVVGFNRGDVFYINVTFDGDMQIITDYSVGGEGWAGGLIGINMNGRVTKCTVEGSIYVRRNSSTVGGLAGYTYGGYFYDNIVTSGQLQAVQGGSGAWIVCGGGVGQEKSDHVASENNNTLSAERIVNSVNWIFSTKHTDALWYGYRSNSSNWNFADYYGNVG